MQEKINQLNTKFEGDPGFAESLFNLENGQEVQSFLKEQGLEFTLEEIDAFKNALIKNTQKDELSDEDLEEVAGGFVLTTGMIATTASIIGGTATGAGFIHTITRSRW